MTLQPSLPVAAMHVWGQQAALRAQTAAALPSASLHTSGPQRRPLHKACTAASTARAAHPLPWSCTCPGSQCAWARRTAGGGGRDCDSTALKQETSSMQRAWLVQLLSCQREDLQPQRGAAATQRPPTCARNLFSLSLPPSCMRRSWSGFQASMVTELWEREHQRGQQSGVRCTSRVSAA